MYCDSCGWSMVAGGLVEGDRIDVFLQDEVRYPGPVSESGTTYTGTQPTATTTIPKANPNVHYPGGLKGGQMPAHPPLQQQHFDASRKPVGTSTLSNPAGFDQKSAMDPEKIHPSSMGTHEQTHQNATVKDKARHAWENVKGAAVSAKDKVVDAFSRSPSESPTPVRAVITAALMIQLVTFRDGGFATNFVPIHRKKRLTRLALEYPSLRRMQQVVLP
jgi:hypothetical protein